MSGWKKTAKETAWLRTRYTDGLPLCNSSGQADRYSWLLNSTQFIQHRIGRIRHFSISKHRAGSPRIFHGCLASTDRASLEDIIQSRKYRWGCIASRMRLRLRPRGAEETSTLASRARHRVLYMAIVGTGKGAGR